MITKVFFALFALVSGWIAVLTLVMLVPNSAPAALVPVASSGFLGALPDHVSIIDMTALGMVLASEDADFVAQLYQAGALVVLPAGLAGCAPLL